MTPKWTLQEDHVHDHHYWLIEEGYGGERWLDESYVEHEHQVGVKEDRRTQAMRSFKSKQSAQMKSQSTGAQTETSRMLQLRESESQKKGQGYKLTRSRRSKMIIGRLCLLQMLLNLEKTVIR